MEKEQLKKIFDFLENKENKIPKGKDGFKWKLFFNEPITQENLNIEIKKNYSDDFDVNYQVTIGSDLIEIEGTLVSFNTGRDVEYEFEPTDFDDESQQYYDIFWKKIEEEILDKFYSIPIK